MNIWLFILILSCTLVKIHCRTTQVSQANAIDKICYKFGLRTYLRTFVIEAGTTSMKLTYYGFISYNGKLKLHKQLTKEVKPGFSAFASHPDECKVSLEKLLKEVKKIVPEQEWPKTTVKFVATAGIKHLAQKQTEELLSVAQEYLKDSKFKLADNRVVLLDKSEEGLLLWFSLNLILGKFNEKSSNMAVALNIGSTSTNVAFSLPVSKSGKPSANIKHRGFFDLLVNYNPYTIYSESYMDLGLVAMRHRIFTMGTEMAPKIFISNCLNPAVKIEWIYNGTEYRIKGPKDGKQIQINTGPATFNAPVVDIPKCEVLIKALLNEHEKPLALGKKDIFILGEFYNRFLAANLIDMKGSVIKVQDILGAAQLKCLQSKLDEPLLCMDLLYIYHLLKDFFGLNDKDKINAVKVIQGVNMNLSLAVAYLNLQTKFEKLN